MGNTHISPCLPRRHHLHPPAKLIFPEGEIQMATGSYRRIAGEIMFQFPEFIVCHGNSFYINQPFPFLSIDDELISGETYFVLPIDRCTSINSLSLSSLAALGGSRFRASMADINLHFPFQYSKSADGRMQMKVSQEFLEKLVAGMKKEEVEEDEEGINGAILCSTPELRKRYEKLVGNGKVQVWSPRLETIAEDCKRGRFYRR